MQKVFFLSTCSTCQRILKELAPLLEGFELQDIKQEPISAEALDWLRQRVGSYEALFSRRARKFRALGLHEQSLDEADYRRLILEEYTFLKRPVIVAGEEVFVGSGKKEVAAARVALERKQHSR